MLLVLLHGAFYAVAIPPWDLFDEEQHLDYALKLRDELRIPRLDESVEPAVIQSAVDTDRWSVFQIGRPSSTDPKEMGLEGRSFEGYQPPLYYAAIAPLTLPAGDRALPALYLARSMGVGLLGVFAATAWALARRWFSGGNIWVPFSAALIAGAIPAAAEAAGRVNNDLLVATLISVGLLATLRLVDRPGTRKALLAGLIVAAAIVSKAPGLVALGVLVAGLGLIRRHRRLTPAIAIAAAAPGIAVLALWTLFIYTRYGVLSGTSAFLDMVVPFDPLPASEFLIRVWLNGWSSYWGAYDGGWLRISIGIIGAAIVAVAVIGLVFRRGDDSRNMPGRQYETLMLSGLLGIGLIAVLWVGNTSSMVHPHGRIMLPAYPALAAMSCGGWARLHRNGALVPALIACLGALISAGFWFLPFFYGATS